MCAGWGEVAGGRGQGAGGNKLFSLLWVKRGGGTPLFGLYGYVPLNRVWFSAS